MDGNQLPFHVGERVRIKDGVNPDLYEGLSTNGNEGWVRDVRRDKYGLPMVLIEWDKYHWSYNGAPDQWTFPDHFEKVELAVSKKDKLKDLFTDMLEMLDEEDEAVEEAKITREEPADEVEDSPVLDGLSPEALRILGEYIKPRESREVVLQKALRQLESAEAFMVIGVDHQPDDSAPQGVLVPFTLRYSQTPEAEILVNAVTARIGAQAHEILALDKIFELVNRADDDVEA